MKNALVTCFVFFCFITSAFTYNPGLEELGDTLNFKRTFKFSINGGYSHYMAKKSKTAPPNYDAYFKQLKSGFHLESNFTYYYSERIGVGLKSNFFKSYESIDNFYFENLDGTGQYGMMSDNLSIIYIGPVLAYRRQNKKERDYFLLNFSFGYLGYSNDYVHINSYYSKGGTFGSNIDVGYDIGLSENWSLGFQISYTYGSLTKYKLNDGQNTETIKLESSDYISANHFDLSIGIRYRIENQ